jgi:hypothetical protein
MLGTYAASKHFIHLWLRFNYYNLLQLQTKIDKHFDNSFPQYKPYTFTPSIKDKRNKIFIHIKAIAITIPQFSHIS